MSLKTYLDEVQKCIDTEDVRCKELLSITLPRVKELVILIEKIGERRVEIETRRILQNPPWEEIVIQYYKVLVALKKEDYIEAFKEQNTLAMYPFYYFTVYPRKRSDIMFMRLGNDPTNLEIAARTINKSFASCITDRAPSSISRKWGTYYIAGLLFKTYFKLKQQNLCKNVMKSIKASADLPPFSEFPKPHKVTFLYYHGLLLFLDADYALAEEKFVAAFRMCPKSSFKNKEYLIPVWLAKGTLPSKQLLSSYPRMYNIYSPFIESIRDGNVKKFDESLVLKEKLLVAQNTFLTVELARQIAVRVLFKKVNRGTRLPLGVFQAALKFVGIDIEMKEVMWYMASMIQKGHIRGYMAHQKQFLVLSEANPFPPLGNNNLPASSTPSFFLANNK
ncbi:3931_t:CDS:2 [Entrophospora sp. SA101]|nr:12951_t:CDS:2 [Entrophospora sp. SA101]CAJ0763944.1 3931_t:CDS:2 [Entrophospora sp. SA101]CAJ0830171.1 3719_t:CDS:2 [Entrophospora sp. SA101]